MRSRIGLVILSLTSAVAAASELDRARTQVAALDFKGAAKTLERARLETGYSREETLAYFELRAIVSGTLNDGKGALEAFRTLLTLDPSAQLKGRFAPRVMTPFYEAKSYVTEHGHLAAARRDPRLEAHHVVSVGFTVSDEQKLVRTITAHVREDGGPWRVEALGADGTVATNSARVEVWLELLGERGWVLATEGSASTPLVFEAPPVVVAQPKVSLVPPPAPPPQLELGAEAPRWRPAAWTLLGTGVAALGTAVAFGLMANGERQRFVGAERDALGNVTGLSRLEALDLDQAARLHATIANVLFIAGGSLAAGGAGLWIAGALTPSRGGASGVVLVGGALP